MFMKILFFRDKKNVRFIIISLQEIMNNLIRLIYQDKDLRNEFLSKIYLSYAQDKTEVLFQDISLIKDKELEQKGISIENNTFNFIFGNQEQNLEKVEEYILLLEVGEEFEDPFYKQINQKKIVPQKFLIVICKPSLKIREAIIKKFRAKIIETISAKLKIQMDETMVVEICLKESKELIPAQFINKLLLWAKAKKQNMPNKDCNIKSLALDKIMNLISIYDIQQQDKQDCVAEILLGNFQGAFLFQNYLQHFLTAHSENLDEVLRKKAELSVYEILKKCGASDPEQFCQQIIEGKLNQVVLQIPTKHREKLQKDCKACQPLCQYFALKNKQSSSPIQQAITLLQILLKKYDVKDIKNQIDLIINGGIELVIEKIPIKMQKQFKQELIKCEKIKIYIQKCLKQAAQAQINVILTKYNVAQADQLALQLLSGNIDSALNQIPNKKKGSFKIDYQKCTKLANYLIFVSQKSESNQIESANNLKEKAKTALYQLTAKYKVKNEDQCVESLLENNMEDAILCLKKENRNEFKEEVSNCKEYQSFKKGLQTIASDKSPEVLKIIAVNSLKILLEKYSIKEKNQCLDEILNKNIQDASYYTRKAEREKFVIDIESNKQLQQYWKCQQSIYCGDHLYETASKAVRNILQKNGVTELQICLDNILNNNFTTALQQVRPKKRQACENELKNCEQLSLYLNSLKNIQVNIEEVAKKLLREICIQFNVKQIDECISDILSQQTKSASYSVSKANRQSFLKAIQACQPYQRFIKNDSEENKGGDSILKAKQSISKILSKFKVQKFDECMQEILNGDLQNAQFNVKKLSRGEFRRQIQECQDYIQYCESLKSPNKLQIIQKKAKSSIKFILQRYVADVQECLNNFFNSNIKDVLSEIKPAKIANFQQEVKNSNDYQAYLTSIQGNGFKKQMKQIKTLLLKANLGQSKLTKYMKDLEEGNLSDLKNELETTLFYLILNKLVQQVNYSSLLIQNQSKNIGQISYFYYLLKDNQHLNEILAKIINFLESNIKVNGGGMWIQELVSLQTQSIILKIQNQIVLLKEINQHSSNDKINHLIETLEHIKEVPLLSAYKNLLKFLQDSLKNQQLDLEGVIQKKNEKKFQIQMQKNKLEKQQSQKQILKLEKIIKASEKIKDYQKMLNINSSIDLALRYIDRLYDQKIEINQISQLIQKSHEASLSSLSLKDQQGYFTNKILEIKYRIYSKYFILYKQDIESLMIEVIFQEKKYKILQSDQGNYQHFAAKISKQIGKNISEMIIELIYDDKTIILSNKPGVIYNKPKIINCFKKIQANLQFKESILKVQISKNLHPYSLKIIVYQSLQNLNIKISLQNICLYGVFGQSSLNEITQQIDVIEMKKVEILKCLKVILKMSVNVYYEADSFRFMLYSDKTVEQLKELIFEKSKIPIKSQSLFFVKENSQQLVFSQTLQQIEPNLCNLTFILISKMNLEHYGFHQNYSLTFQDYSQFFVEKADDIQDMVDSCSLKKEEQRNFFNQLIKFLYSAVKRRFPFSHITDQVKSKLVHKNSQQIWAGGDFSNQFLIYYILYNADQKLRIELMHILRDYVPLPLYFREFQNINHIKNQWVINHQILWLLHSGLCITSIGLHTQKIAKEKGKTYLNNQIFYTKFQNKNAKHPISSGCPQTMLKVLGSSKIVNIIDIPSSTSEEIVDNILCVTDLLVIHSWRGKKETEKYINDIKTKFGVKNIVAFLRDCNSKEQTIFKVNQAKLQSNCFLELHNLEENALHNQQLPFIRVLRDKIWDLSDNCLKKSQQKGKSIYKLFKNSLFEDFNKKINILKDKFLNMKVIFEKYEHIKDLRKKNTIQSLEEASNIKNNAIKNKLAPQFEEILRFINQNKKYSEFLMLRLRQILKQIKNERERQYFIIARYKDKISLLSADKKEELKILVDQAYNQISCLEKICKINKKQTQAQMVEELSHVFDYFENEIKSNFFTIELAWRQLQYLTTLSSQVKLDDGFLIDFLIDLKRKEIANSQPFQLLDGDLLEMPKNIMKKVFEGMNERVAVITVLGPQSSGKSTLLNFLFGCDFGTSEGRCTKGVYGTYFKFSNIMPPNCDGVFLIDTEGLFATINKKDTARRKAFDSKLVLFCLAVSDFVIINTKGNLDAQSTKILKSSLDRFAALTQQNIEWPEIFLVLNQNNSSDIKTSFADINKLRDIFSGQNSHSLSQAYSITELTHQNIIMLPQDEIIVKKQPKKQFLAVTNKIQNCLINKIESKNTTKHISVVIDLMERVWQTIQAFPDLGRTASKRIQQIQQNIKEWRISKIENLSVIRERVFNDFKQSKINKKKCTDLFSLERVSIQNEFRQTFLSQKLVDAMAEDQKLKIQLQEKKIQLAFEAVKYELISQIKDLEKFRLAEKSKSQGGQYEKQAIRIVKKIQRQEKKSLSQQQKIKHFDNAFNRSLQRLKMIASPEQQLQSYFERAYQFYLSASNISVTNKSKSEGTKHAGLPRPQWKCQEKMSYEQFSDSIRQKVIRVMGKQSNKYIEFKKAPPTKILDQSSRTDAKLEYFNMRSYFQKVKISNYYQISQENLKKSLKIQLLKNYISEMYSLNSQFQDKIVEDIYEGINKFFKGLGFEIENLNNFQKNLEYKLKYVTIFTSQPELKVRIIQQNLKNKSKSIKNKETSKSRKANSSSITRNSSRQAQNYYYQASNSYNGYGTQYSPSSSYQSTSPDQSEQRYSSASDESSLNSIIKVFQKESFADLSSYLNIPLLENKIIQIYKSQYNHALAAHLGKCLKDIIRWDAIKKKIEKNKEFDHIKSVINKNLTQILNKDLSSVGLSVNCADLYELIYNGREALQLNFKRTNEIKSFQSESDFFKNLKLLDKFDEIKIRQGLKRSLSKVVGSYFIQIGSYYEQTFQVKAKYRNNRELQTYISNDTNTVYVNLSSDTMKEFVYNELVSKKTISSLFNKIDAIITKSPNCLNLNTITGIYIDVNRQITQFNNDLGQVSHKLTLLFTGYIHLYTVYLTWKRFSQMALKIANKPYFDFLQNREKQLSFFLKQTSDNDNQRVIGQTERFLNQVIEYCKIIIEDHKQKVNKNETKQFKKDYPRSVIQSKIDNQCFSISSKPNEWIDYLMNPKDVIEKKYNSLIQFTASSLGQKYKLCDKIWHIINQFKETISLLLEKLKSEGLTEDTIHTDIIGLQSKGLKQVSISDNQVVEKINILMMNFMLDILVKDEKQTYLEVDFNITIKNSHIKIQRQPTPTFQSLIKKLKDQKQSITRFYSFVETLHCKLYEFVEVNGVKLLKFDEAIKKMMNMTAQDEKDFISRVSIKICKQMCPGCQRICGVEEAHTSQHECRFGHQMRALGGVKLSNGDASVIRCEDVPLMSELKFNGKKMTWKQFKQYWEAKSDGSWSFSDLSKNINKEIFIKAWDIVGEVICKNHGVKYVKSNAIEAQKAAMSATISAPTHYIFALDDSGSMSDGKWDDLMLSFKTAIQEIKKNADAQKQIKVSILIQGSNCILFQENITPNDVNLNVPVRYGGNNFADTFSKAYALMTKYVSSAKIKYIFMTDGGCTYPSSQVIQIKQLKNAHPNKIEYYGIEFQTSGDTMKLISKQLDGSNKISHNVSQLTTAYLEIINRKI